MTTQRQIEANQSNSKRSTGPRTDEGKEQSRRNALKHGLSGKGIVLPDDEHDAIERRKDEWKDSFPIADPHQEWLYNQFITATVQIDRCQTEDRTLRTTLAERASTCWDDDRRAAAEHLAAGLARKPSLVSSQLRQTAQGADWLLEHWESLGRALEQKGEWTEAQRSLALDLLGTPLELRDPRTTKLDPIGPDDDPRAHRVAVVAREIARLRHARETYLVERDAREQEVAEIGLPSETPRPLSLLRRYEAACRRLMKWALAQLPRGSRARTKTALAATAPIDVTLIDPDGPPALSAPSLDDELAELTRLPEVPRQKEAAQPAPAPAPAPAVASRPSPSPSPVPFSGRIEPFSVVPVRASAEFEEILASTPRDHRRPVRRP